MNYLLCNFVILDWLWLIILGVILITFIVAVLILLPIKVWFKSIVSGLPINIFKLISLKSRKIDVENIVLNYIKARKAGIYIDIDELETHMSAGGNIEQVVNALIFAETAKVEISIDTIKAIDLANKNVVEIVKAFVNTKTMETESISCVARDGLELKLKFKVCLKPKLEEIVGNTGEDVLLAKIAENAVSVISGYENQNDVMQNAEDISKNILLREIDKDCSYKLIDLCVSQVEIGRDIGAMIRASQIEEEKMRVNLNAEQQKAQAILEEQKMKIKVQQMNAEKVKAEMEVPKAISQAFKDGKMNIMDYYKMQNIMADTEMRKSLTKSSTETEKKNFLSYDDDDDE